MDVEKLFHMAGGDGENSYAQNSSLQKKASDRVKHITIEALQDAYLAVRPNSFGVADLGCSSGPNTLSFIRETVESIEAVTTSCHDKANKCRPEFIRVYLNDLPTNDFNSIFKSLPDLYRELHQERGDHYNNGSSNSSSSSSSSSLLVAAYPGSFYGRLFPDDFLHFVYSSYSLHWLSKVPPRLYDEHGRSINKGKIYISETSPPTIAKAYESQFQQDFSLFLRLRSQELVSGGRMVLILLGRIGHDHVDRGNYFFWEILSRSLAILASQGTVDKEKLDSYDVHFYAASKDEMEAEICRNGDFEIERLEMYETGNDSYRGGGGGGGGSRQNYGSDVAMTVRAIQGPMLGHHFGEEILDPLFDIYRKMVDEEVAREEIKPITFVLVLRKKL